MLASTNDASSPAIVDVFTPQRADHNALQLREIEPPSLSVGCPVPLVHPESACDKLLGDVSFQRHTLAFASAA
jgi:hypothetical protein